VEKVMKSLQAPGFRSANWQKYDNKELWVVDAVAKTGTREWFWIDDEMANQERLQHLGLDPSRCLKVNPKGANELEVLKDKLLQILSRSSTT
jgi:hypothetical protein